ncbi:MAG: DUF6531 domain-containing protein [Acidimicrobiales bacterium]
MSTDGGASWSVQEPLGNYSVSSISCPSTSNCYAVGSVVVLTAPNTYTNYGAILATTNGGNTWFNEHVPGVPFYVTGGPYGANEGAGGGNNNTNCGCSTGAPPRPHRGGPVDTASGEFYTSSTDISVPGPGVPLNFTRTYSSVVAQSQATAGAPGPLGYGWSSNLTMSLAYNSTTSIATVTNENGSQSTFNYDAVGAVENSWCPSDASTAVYCPTAPRTLATLSQDTTTGIWTMTREVNGQTAFTFNSAGTLTGIQDAQGDTLESSIGTPGNAGCLSSANSCVIWTSSATGRTLAVSFNNATPQQQIIAVVATGGSSVSYSYYTQSCSPSVSGSVEDLASVSTPTGTTKFTYDTSYPPNTTSCSPTYEHDLITLTKPDGAITTNSYNSSGQVKSQSEPDGKVLSFSYSGDNFSPTGGSTTVTSSFNGNSSQDQYNYQSGVLMSEQVGQPNLTSSSPAYVYNRDPASLQANQVVDLARNVTSNTLGTPSACSTTVSTASCGVQPTAVTDPMGNTTDYAYTNGVSGVPNGLQYCKVSPAEVKNGVTCPSSAPTTVAAPNSDPYPGATITYYNSSGQVVGTTDPLGNTTINAYTTAGSGVPSGLLYCSVDAANYASGVTCPSTPPTTPPTGVTGYTTNIYNASGTLASSTTPGGATTTNTYANTTYPWLPSKTTGPNGDTTTYTYNQAGQVTESTVTFNGYSATTINAYDSSGRLYCTESAYDVSLDIYFSGGAASYPYNCPSTPPSSPPAPGTSPWNGAQVTIYNAAGQVADSVSPIGGVTQYAYDQAGNKYCTVGPLAYAKGVTCPTYGQSKAGATITTYNALGQVVQVTDPIGGVTLNSYNASGNLTQTQVQYVPWTKPNTTTVYSHPTVTTSYSYNADNQQTSSTVDPGGTSPATTSQEYDPNGNVYCSVSAHANKHGYQCPPWQASWISSPESPSTLYSTSPSSSQANNVTTNFYNADGNLVQTTNPNVDTTITSYDPNGRPYCQIDPVNFAKGTTCPTSPPTLAPTGKLTGYTTTIYDAAGNTVSTTDPVGNTTAYTYSPTGLKLTATTGAGSSAAQTTTYCHYQPTSCPKSGAPPNGGGAASMLYSIQVPSGEITTSTYFPGGSLETKTNPAGTANYVYWENGQLLQFTDSNPSGYAPTLPITKTYYQDGQLCWSARIAVSTVPSCANPPSSGVTTYSYDSAGDMLSQSYVPPSTLPKDFFLNKQTISYTYYSPGNIAAVVYPSYGTVTNPTAIYQYDATGQMTSVTDWSGNTVSFTHDLNGNITAQNNPGGANTTFSYDNANLMTQATTCLGGTASAISPQVTTSGGSTKGGRPSATTSLTVRTMEKFFGTRNHPATPTRSTSNSTLSPATSTTTSSSCSTSPDALTQSFAGGTPTGGSYNANGQVTQYYQEFAYSGGSLTYARNYSYDPAGRLIYQNQGTIPNPQGSAPNNFSYDPSNNPTLVSSHDAAGNFDTYSQIFNSGGQVTSETPTGSTGGSYAYSYNSIGALSNSVSGSYNLSYGYNTIGQMTSYSFLSATNYLYNAAGLEAALSTGSAASDTTQFTWGNLGGLPQLLSDSKDYFIYGPGSTPVEQYNITSSPPAYNPTFLTYFKPSDTWLVTNLTGQVTNATGYDAGGNVSNGSPGTIFGYQGQYQDTSTNTSGFTNMRARWYDSQSGVFTSVDPALSSTNQPYQYANGDPVNNSDPSGLCTAGNISCFYENELWYQRAAGTGSAGYPLSPEEARKFLIDNNFSKTAAQDYVSSFKRPISMNITSQLPLPIFRYYSGTGKQGLFFANTYFSSACAAQNAYHLHPPWTRNTARYVAQVAPNGSFDQAPLVLEGHVLNGNPRVLQYFAFDPSEFVYGQGVQTDSGTYPPRPPMSFPIPGFPVDDGGE